MFGTISTVESVEYLYTTFLRDYDGFYSQDQFSYRSDPTRAMERSMINFANLSLKAIKILHENDKLNDARTKGDAPTILDQISPFLVG